MKLNEISAIINLSNNPTTAVIEKLRPNDLVLYENEQYTVSIQAKRFQKTSWIIGIETLQGAKKYIKVIEDSKPKMTPHEKRSMKKNIEGVVEKFKHDEKRMVSIVKNYYINLVELNHYADTDVRECLSLFPLEIIKKSGVVI